MASESTHTRRYAAAFAALLVLTVATVGAARLQTSGASAVAIGLAIAAVKASLVAIVFMHLWQERRMVHLTVALTAVLFAGLFALTLWTEADHAPGTRFGPPFDSVPAPSRTSSAPQESH
jgi:cytochrome c oxidase subunit 4